MAQILYGKIVAEEIRLQIKETVDELKTKNKIPKLAIVLPNNDPSSLSYVNSIQAAAEKLGLETLVEKPNDFNQSNLELIVAHLANDKSVDGIMIQTPLPEGIDMAKLSSLLPIEKDVDGLSPKSAGLLIQGFECFAPATAQAVIEILKYYHMELPGKNAVVIGRSNIVGKPTAQLLLKENSTVSICHSKTKDLKQFIDKANILVVAAGQSGLITKELVHENLIIIDVGTNFDNDRQLTGDVDFEAVIPIVKAISPVPGGVGPVTSAVLLKHVCQSAKNNL